MATSRTASTDTLAQMADNIRRLVQPYRHTEPYETWTPSRNRVVLRHTSWHPPLLMQLADTAHRTRAQPNLEALDRLRRISRDAAGWKSHFVRPWPGTLGRDIRAMVGAAPTLQVGDQERLAAAVARWHNWCMVLGGWTTPPWRPHAPCPQCDALPGQADGHPTGLRIHIDRSTAICLSCDSYWDPATIGILANHIRAYTGGRTITIGA